MKLALNACFKFILGLVLVGAVLFIPAGGFNYLNGWLFMALLFCPMLILGVVLLIKAPNLLKKRLNAKEKDKSQRAVVALSGLLFVAGFIVAGLDFRFGWSVVPTWVIVVASVVLVLSYALYGEVMRENAYLSRTIEVQENQKVIDSGLYSIVRHPMYAVTVWLFLSIPLILGSWWALICFAPYIIVIAVRIIGEERVLQAELNGYTEYQKKVRYRLIPFVW